MNELPNPTGDDGEILDIEGDVEKPKRKPKPREMRVVRLPAIIVFPLALALLALSVVLFVSRWAVTAPTVTSPAETEAAMTASVEYYMPAQPYDQAVVINGEWTDGTVSVTQMYTDTPAAYAMPLCGKAFSQRTQTGTILFISGERNNREIFAVQTDGQGLCRLTQNLIQEDDVRWSPDGSTIAFRSRRNDSLYDDIFTIATDTTRLVNVTGTLDTTEYLLDWSADSKQLRFFMHPDNVFNGVNLYSIDRDGSHKQRLDLNVGDAYIPEPSWSPDDRFIAYFTSQGQQANTFKLYTMNADGSGIRNLPSRGAKIYGAPAWSPDGKKLAYGASIWDADSGIWITDMEDLSVQQLTKVGSVPTWSPDGQYIAYNWNNAIYIVSVTIPIPRLVLKDPRMIGIVGWR